MDTGAIKKFAVWARRELIERVSQKAGQYGVTQDAVIPAYVSSIHGVPLSATKRQQRIQLIKKVGEDGFSQVMEEVAYTWFNRFAALRFMEVNGYLPGNVRVFTDDRGRLCPQLLTDALQIGHDDLDDETIRRLQQDGEVEALYKKLLIGQCNALGEILPLMFETINDYTKLLLPDDLLCEGSVIDRMVKQIPVEDWMDQVQVIGWLYQYYNSESKNKVFSRPSEQKIRKEEVPAATQLFTPRWIVRYLVENSLGRALYRLQTGESEEEYASRMGWKFYLPEATPSKRAPKAERPEEITFLDPCMGSGHILVYAFDVLMQAYIDAGYSAEDAVHSILENNLFGLEVDDRVLQLAYFALMMKARAYDERFFDHPTAPKLCSVKESNSVTPDLIGLFGRQKPSARQLSDIFFDAKEYGSLLHVPLSDLKLRLLQAKLEAIGSTVCDNLIEQAERRECVNVFTPLLRQAALMIKEYTVVCTNPPYMGSSGMSGGLNAFVKQYYPDSRSDLFAVFMERCAEYTAENGYCAMITMQSWMFLSGFEALRKKMLHHTLINMAHLGARAFDHIGGEVVQTTAFVSQKAVSRRYVTVFKRLTAPVGEEEKRAAFLSDATQYRACTDDFAMLPGSPVAYWVSERLMEAFASQQLGEIGDARQGMIPGNVDEFVRFWFEPDFTKIGFHHRDSKDIVRLGFKWFPYNKGGSFRRWYGNIEHVINMENNGYAIKYAGANRNYRLRDPGLYFREAITWSKVSSSRFSARLMPEGNLFDIAGCCIFNLNENLLYCLGAMNSNVIDRMLQIISPTLNYEVEHIKSLPIIFSQEKRGRVEALVRENIELSKADWDSFELSWDFRVHPLVRWAEKGTVAESFLRWQSECDARCDRLRKNEEELNFLFGEIYHLQDEMPPEAEGGDVTVRRADLQRDVKSLISYAVGCMLGRYSLDAQGLAYAGGAWDSGKYAAFLPEPDNILPVSGEGVFDHDIADRFEAFIGTVFGEENLENNLRFIADALGGKGSPREVIRRYFSAGFYRDHCRTYQNRPIYWMFDSGRQVGLRCLVYRHRMTPETLERIRTDCLGKWKEHLLSASKGSEKDAQRLSALEEYAEKLLLLQERAEPMEPDEGIKKSYARFQSVLAKRSG